MISRSNRHAGEEKQKNSDKHFGEIKAVKGNPHWDAYHRDQGGNCEDGNVNGYNRGFFHYKFTFILSVQLCA
jgi:hypothetical protein